MVSERNRGDQWGHYGSALVRGERVSHLPGMLELAGRTLGCGEGTRRELHAATSSPAPLPSAQWPQLLNKEVKILTEDLGLYLHLKQ